MYASPGQPVVNKSRAEQWMGSFHQVQAFYREHGHLTIPNKTLAQWLTYQRLHAKNLTDKQLELLDSIKYKDAKIASGVRERDEKAWEMRCDEIEKFILEHGNTRNLPGYLRSWLTRQKRKFQENSLNRRKQERLKSIGIKLSDFKRRTTGDARKERDGAEWNKNLEKLKRYRELHGNCNVPYRFAHDPSLGSWASNQRTRYKRVMEREPTEDVIWIKQLESIGFEWDCKPKQSTLRARASKKRKVSAEDVVVNDNKKRSVCCS